MTQIIDDTKFVAAVDLLNRTGARQFQVRYCDEEKPVTWIAAALWDTGWEVAGAMNPVTAVFRLCDLAIDGGTCQHCQRPAGFDPGIETMPMDAVVCWYQYDPGTHKFTKGCAK
jgi:hypothetical protein